MKFTKDNSVRLSIVCYSGAFCSSFSALTGLTLEWSLWSVQTWLTASGVEADIIKRGTAGVVSQAVKLPNQGLLVDRAKMMS